jgi:hypothetical protein
MNACIVRGTASASESSGSKSSSMSIVSKAMVVTPHGRTVYAAECLTSQVPNGATASLYRRKGIAMVQARVRDVTQQQALVDVALAHGFTVLRETPTHWFLKKATANFKVPKLEPVNEHMLAAINRIIAEVNQRANRSRGSQALLPLAVNFQDETWAVASKNATQFLIQSLDNGFKKWVAKTDCVVVADEDLRAMPDDTAPANGEPTMEQTDAALPRLTIHKNGASVATAEEEPAPPAPVRSSLDQLEELDPMAYWRRMTERQIDNYTGQINDAMAKIQPVVERRDALVAALAAASGKPISGSVVRRVSLPSTAAPKKTGGAGATSKRYAPELIDKVKHLLKTTKLPNRAIAAQTGVPASAISYYRHTGVV